MKYGVDPDLIERIKKLEKDIEVTKKLKTRESFNNVILKEESDKIYLKN